MLEKIQKSFAKFLTENDSSDLEKFIGPKHRKALIIHKNTFKDSLFNALRDNFEQTEILLGKDYFRKVGLEYVNSNLKFGLDLDYYGEDFGGFLDRHQTKDFVNYIKDFCDFEFALNKISLGPNGKKAKFKSKLNIAEIYDFTFEQKSEKLEIKKGDYEYILSKNNGKIHVSS